MIERWAWLLFPAGILLGVLIGISSQGWGSPGGAWLALAAGAMLAVGAAFVSRRWLGRRLDAMTAVARRLGFGSAALAEYPRLADRIARRVGRGEALARDLQHLLDNMADGVVVLDGDDHVVAINGAAIRIFGADHNEDSGISLARLTRDAEIIDLVGNVREDAVTRRRIVRPIQPDLTLQVVATPVAVGSTTRVLLILQDVTAIEGQREAQRDLIANISHDLRTPIAAIKSLCEALLGGAADLPRYRDDFLNRIDSEADRLIGLTEDVIAAARADALTNRMDWEQFDLSMMVAELGSRLDPVARRAQVEMEVSDAGPLPVIADRPKLEIATANLILNAIKFTPPHKAIRVGCEEGPEGALVRIADQGSGVEPEIQDRIFERFFKGDRARGAAGAGLGLTIAKQMIELHGGRIQVLSAGADSGSEFILSIPDRRGTNVAIAEVDGSLNAY